MINAALEHTIPVAHKMGVTALEARPGYARTRVPIEGNGNHFGVMYAGVLFTVAEVLGGIIPMATFDNSRFYPLVKDLQITFKRAAKTDVEAEAKLDEESIARIASAADANGKADFTLDAAITDAAGEVVATTHGIYQLRAHGR
ncbi:DUF4442 domain-containing protein [Skermania sp. ID1734]|nr:DUF4442 domain-containing protein [Skermania sp. ID1734]